MLAHCLVKHLREIVYYTKDLNYICVYKSGVFSFSTDLSNYILTIRTSTKPSVEIEKWGLWLKDYDTDEIELRNSFIKRMKCQKHSRSSSNDGKREKDHCGFCCRRRAW